jgi:hypothetical protein
MGSASELEYHLLLAKDLKIINPQDHAVLSQRAIELKRMLTARFRSLALEKLTQPLGQVADSMESSWKAPRGLALNNESFLPG